MLKLFNVLVLVLFGVWITNAQVSRLFLDIPSVYLHSPNLEAITNNGGLGVDAGFGIGTHHVMAKFSGGTTVTADFESDKIEKSINWQPFVRLEAGAGLWRTNGNKCSTHDSNAFTVLPKGSILYAFTPKEIQYTVGVEFSYFRIRDYFKNMEIFIDGGYNLTSQTTYASFGLRQFLNLRA